MELDDPEIKLHLDKIMEAIAKDRNLLCRYPKTTGNKDQRITAENLCDIACNHIFDDHPEWFGLEDEFRGYRLRGYFHRLNRCYVEELHRAYPQLMESERPEFLEMINRYRLENGLEPISL